MALVLLLAVPLALVMSRVFGGVVEDLVTAPFLYLAWIGRLYLRTVPRILFWGALLLFGLALLSASVLNLRARRGRAEAGEGSRNEAEGAHEGTVGHLASRVRFAARSPYFRGRLARRLGELALKILGDREAGRRGDVERVLRALDAPPEVRAFLCEGAEPIPRAGQSGVVVWLRRAVRERAGRNTRYEDLERAVRWLESRMEGL